MGTMLCVCLGFIFINFLIVLSNGEECDMSNRKASVSIFVSSAMAASSSKESLTERLSQKLIPKLNELYSRNKMEYGKVEFNLVSTEIFTEAIDVEIAVENEDTNILVPFCNYVTSKGFEGDIALYIISETEKDSKLGSFGKAFGSGICSEKRNCAVVVGDNEADGVVVPSLVAHEFGHLFSFTEDNNNCPGIMFDPKQSEEWSMCTRSIIKEHFQENKYEMICLKNDCGEVPTLPEGMVTDEEREILNENCAAWEKDTKFKFGANYQPGNNPGSFNEKSLYGKVITQNPEWYLSSRVCYGIPCIKENESLGGIPGTFMNEMPCAVGKKCQNTIIDRKVTNAECL